MNLGIVALAATQAIQEHLIAMYISSDLYISPDWGVTWIKANYAPTANSYIYDVVGNEQSWLMSNNYGIHRSTDQGRNWELIFRETEWIHFDLEQEGSTIYGGIRNFKGYGN